MNTSTFTDLESDTANDKRGEQFPNDAYAVEERKDEIDAANEYTAYLLKNMPERWRIVCYMYYGMNGYEKQSMINIGTIFGCSKQQINNILKRMNEYIRTEKILSRVKTMADNETDWEKLDKIKRQYHKENENE